MTDTKAKIVLAAQRIIADEGWAAATTRRVAEVAAVRPGVIHYHVGSIQELRRIAVLDGVAAYFGSLRDLGGDRSVLVDRLHEVVEAIASREPNDQDARLLYASIGAAGQDPVLRESIGAEIMGLRRALAEHVDDGEAQILAAAIDGFVLQRAFGVEVAVEPVRTAAARMLQDLGD